MDTTSVLLKDPCPFALPGMLTVAHVEPEERPFKEHVNL